MESFYFKGPCIINVDSEGEGGGYPKRQSDSTFSASNELTGGHGSFKIG